MTEPADNHPVRPTLPTEDKVLPPNTYRSAMDPFEFTTSEDIPTLPKRVARETIEVMADGPGLEGYIVAKVSLCTELQHILV